MDKFANQFFSMRMMAIAMVIFFVAIGGATLLESTYDTQTSKLYVYNATDASGGESASGELLTHCESYEPLTDDWHREEKLLGPRKDHACVATHDTLYLCGGVSKTEPYSDHIW